MKNLFLENMASEIDEHALKVSSDGAATCGHCGDLDIWQESVTVHPKRSTVIKFICNACKKYSWLHIEQRKDITYFSWQLKK